MPGSDKTGPEGKGPKTGRRLGDYNDKKLSQNKPNQNNDSWLDIILRVLSLLKK
jgi:hypothetical protein